MSSTAFGGSPCYFELIAIIVAGSVHVTTEVLFSDTTARLCNIVISLMFAAYIVWRIRTSPGVLRIWGMRRDNLRPALIAHLGFVAIVGLVLFGLAPVIGSPTLPTTFWVSIALYPAYGVAQQFALQNLLARNLQKIFSSGILTAVMAAALFGLSHAPRLELVAMTFVAGVFLTLIYFRVPNLWAVGLAHGILATLAIYLVLGEDPGAEILRTVGSR